MKKQIYFATFVLLITGFLLTSCEGDISDSDSERIEGSNTLLTTEETGELTYPNRTWMGKDIGCIKPKRDCFPDIIVYPDDVPYIGNLDAAILIGSLDDYFSDTTNYNYLFPGFTGQPLTDLQNGLTTLVKFDNQDSTITYYIEYTDGSGRPNYGN